MVREKEEIKCGRESKWGRSNKREARFRQRKKTKDQREELSTGGEGEKKIRDREKAKVTASVLVLTASCRRHVSVCC